MSYINKALELAERGFDPLPIVDKRCFVKGWPDVDCQNEELQAAWHRDWPDADVAVRCTDLCVIDIDVKPGQRGLATWMEWQRKYGAFPQTRAVQTRSGGLHYYYRKPPYEINKKKFPGVDLKVGNAYVVAPPSEGYQWLNDFPVVSLPGFFKSLSVVKYEPPVASFTPGDTDWSNVISKMAQCPPGRRDDTLWRYLSTMALKGASHQDMLELCSAAEAAGLPRYQVRQKLKRVWSA